MVSAKRENRHHPIVSLKRRIELDEEYVGGMQGASEMNSNNASPNEESSSE